MAATHVQFQQMWVMCRTLVVTDAGMGKHRGQLEKLHAGHQPSSGVVLQLPGSQSAICQH